MSSPSNPLTFKTPIHVKEIKLTSKLPIHSLDPINVPSLSSISTRISCILLMLGTIFSKFSLFMIHEQMVCNVLYPHPQP